MYRRSLIPALMLITLGTLFLFDNLGVAIIRIPNLIGTWWPLAPILIGIKLLMRRPNAGSAPKSATNDAD